MERMRLPGHEAAGDDVRGESWMSGLPHTVELTGLNVPGTHDSGTYRIPKGIARTQDLDFGQQLRMGVRFLDVRCRHIEDKFAIHHGEVYADLNFDDVLGACIRFLDVNPLETIIMSIRDEYKPRNCTRSYERTFDEYVQRYPRWYLGDTPPRLGDVRGRIVLVRRFAATAAKGIDATAWRGDTFTVPLSWGALQVQDHFSPSLRGGIREKWEEVRNHLDRATVGATADWYINFASAVTWNTWPVAFANGINPLLGADLAVRGGRCGTVLQDFCTDVVVRSVIRSNARQPA